MTDTARATEPERCPDCDAEKGQGMSEPCSIRFIRNQSVNPFHGVPDVEGK